jgi:ParB-like chromosome segregation protein Spo0J
VWLADVLAPITVMPVDGGFVVLDGHHRVSVARSRGQRTIPAVAA